MTCNTDCKASEHSFSVGHCSHCEKPAGHHVKPNTNSIVDDTTTMLGGLEVASPLPSLRSNFGDETTALELVHVNHTVPVTLVGVKTCITVMITEEGPLSLKAEKPEESTNECIKVTSTRNLNNLIGHSHICCETN